MLIWALFAFVVLSGLATVALRASGSERRLSKAASVWNQSFYAAEAGLEAALQVVSDSALEALASGDSLDLGWRSLGGVIEYRAVFRRIDDGTLDLFLLRSTGRKPGLFGGQTAVNLVFTTAAALSGFQLTTNLSGRGNASVTGECRVHVNDWLSVPGHLTTNGPVTATGQIDGDITTEGDGDVQANAPPETVPGESTDGLCDAADYTGGPGWLQDRDGHITVFGSGIASNWRVDDGGEIEIDGPPEPGTYCMIGSVDLEGSGIDAGGAPLELTMVATGAIELDGTDANLRAAHPQGVLFAADGDVSVAQTEGSLEGDIFAGGHCSLDSPSLQLNGALSCQGGPDPFLAEDHTDTNYLDGDLVLIAQCGTVGSAASSGVRRLQARAWWRGY